MYSYLAEKKIGGKGSWLPRYLAPRYLLRDHKSPTSRIRMVLFFLRAVAYQNGRLLYLRFSCLLAPRVLFSDRPSTCPPSKAAVFHPAQLSSSLSSRGLAM